MIKRFIYIFIPFLAVLLMSHNVNADAVSQTFYLKYGVYSYGIPANSGAQGGAVSYLTSSDQYNYNVNAYSLNADRIFYSMAFRFNSENTQIDLSSYSDFTFSFSYCSDTQYFAPSSNDLFRVTDYYEYKASSTTYSLVNGTYNYDIDHCRNVLLRGKVGVTRNNNFQLGTTNNGSFTRIFGYNFNETSGAPPLLIISPTVVLYTEPNQADAAIQKEKENVQNASNDSQSSGGSSSSDATTATSSLLSVIGAGVGAITTASPTNCKINGNMGNLNIGNIDLCANPVPSFIAVIGSIIAVLVVLPLVIVLFNRFISIFRSFQG